MVDDAEAEIQALREVFGIPILLCIWHVRRAWLKNLVRKVPNPIVRADMFKQLGQIMNMPGKPCRSSYEKESQAHKLVEDFMVKYKDEDLFINYFMHEWLPRLGMWIRASRMMEHANQETNGSIEAYHDILKSKFLCGRRTIHGLIKRLLCSCHSYFWYQEMLKDTGFKRNFAIMDVVKNSLACALEMPDEYVRFHGDDPKHAKVLSLSKQLHFYTVLNADVEWATCNCNWAIRGNLCKHQVKVMILASIDAQTIIDKGLSMLRLQKPYNSLNYATISNMEILEVGDAPLKMIIKPSTLDATQAALFDAEENQNKSAPFHSSTLTSVNAIPLHDRRATRMESSTICVPPSEEEDAIIL
ncbi:hypothetical protein L7F22_000925 [Adiantum nelumboides]|nr:hypothetical protein [Adiantum nelumboides]